MNSRLSVTVAITALLHRIYALPEAVLPGCGKLGGTPEEETCTTEMDDVDLLQMMKHQVPMMKDKCTGANKDPFESGTHLPCCSSFEQCLGDWYGTNTWSYLCVASCGNEPPPPPSDTGLNICSKAVSMDSDTSVWNVATSSQSCVSQQGIRGDAGFSCADSSGAIDASSIFVDMGSVENKVGCFVWETEDCQYTMRNVKQIDFDVEWDGCSSLWMAPLWTYSTPWAPLTGRQGLSGEIDFVEECPVPTVDTNLGCYNAGQGSGCVDSTHWGESSSSNGPKHMTMTLDSEGNLNIHVCNIDKTGCKIVASYANYLDTVYPTRDGRNNPYKFMSDIFNDRGGDGGWRGCKAVRNPTTTCKYAVTNIRIESNSFMPVFGDPNSKCFVMNAKLNVSESMLGMGGNLTKAGYVLQSVA
eukprot:TRINITY_DN107135_c0_g1_i1.p1 TRINITY_DN107135_c0_g1~~TRINITY_DN107135_c0_g1_i1.p1  ORF type:complete len:414 (-),score=70.83 TRINITY_DN107135_c0_g1_i1:308-1549(-)